MKFDFAKATDITEYAHNHFGYMYKGYEKIFITPDTYDYHILRIIKGYCEDYEPKEDSYILEHQKIGKTREDKISTLNKLKNILYEDDGGNWDYKVCHTIDECIEIVDGGYGINKQ